MRNDRLSLTGRASLLGGLAASLALFTGASAWGQAEVEPNDSKATATPILGIVDGGTITGNSTSASAAGIDTFRIKTAPAALGVYRHRLVITSAPAGHTGTLRGLNQVNVPNPGPNTAGTTDTAVQTSSATATTPPRMNQWYGFGKEEEIYY